MYRVKQYGSIPPPYGGVAVFIKRLTLALNKYGWVCGAFYSTVFEGLPKDMMKNFDKFPRHSRSFFILPEVGKLLMIFRKYDLIHSHLSFTSCFSTWLIHKLLRMPVVYTVHNQMIDSELLRLNFLDKYCLKSLADDDTVQFISVNANVESMLRKHGIKFKRPIKVLPAYIPPVEYGSSSDYLSVKLQSFINGTAPVLLFYAESLTLYENVEIYGLSDAIAAFIRVKSIYKNVKMVICVANVSSITDLNKYKSLLKDHDDSIYWQVGPLTEMWPLLKETTMLLRPTSTDGDSIMVREALAYGLPVVASDVVDRPEGCYIYRYGNLEDLVEKISFVLLQPTKKVIPQEDYTDKMIQIYKDLMNYHCCPVKVPDDYYKV